MNGKIYCSLCGMENYPLLKYCDNCGKLLKTNRITPEPVYDTFNDVLIHNKYRILKTNITEDTYNKIIENIERIILMNLNIGYCSIFYLTRNYTRMVKFFIF